MRYKVSNAMQIPVSIFVPEAATATSQQRASVPSTSRLDKDNEEDRRKSTSVLLHNNKSTNC